uniref:C-type lectin domain-containing protein n=1 Tax=Dicentrarchus labrax TaxID=13489 RepID=A0A8C4DX13_DICLA
MCALVNVLSSNPAVVSLGLLMTLVEFVCLLCRLSGCVLVCHLHTDDVIRYFHAVDTKTTWTEAQRYCRETFTDLATIQDPTNNNEAIQTMQSGKFWIGLSLNDSGWKWSHWDQSDSVQTRFTNWADKEPRFQECVTISGLGEWSAIDCGVEHHVMCYSGESEGFSVWFLFGQKVRASAREDGNETYTEDRVLLSDEQLYKSAAMLTLEVNSGFIETCQTVHSVSAPDSYGSGRIKTVEGELNMTSSSDIITVQS